ncbi:hypothetical protein [Streptomyces sp. NPDC058989]|uniref:hypothetical protein n=1 Tax=Streptomyces sp. NPDC058989 TaxID=3346686 RepID=UPI0036B7CDCD
MALYAREFFAELGLPFTDSTVVGNTYYANPSPDSPLRLRIDFSPTIVADTYRGLRVAIAHPDRGEVDAVALTFEDHDTFRHRDQARELRPRVRGHGTFDKYHRAGEMPWQGADTTGLRAAIEQYSQVWFPGAWKAPAPARTSGRTARQSPSPPAVRSARRSR